MVVSERIPKEVLSNGDEITCGICSEGTLDPEKVNILQEQYKDAISTYAKLLDEYKKASERAETNHVKSLFPGRATWNPPGQILSHYER